MKNSYKLWKTKSKKLSSKNTSYRLYSNRKKIVNKLLLKKDKKLTQIKIISNLPNLNNKYILQNKNFEIYKNKKNNKNKDKQN